MSDLEASSNFTDYWHDVTKTINHLVAITWPITRDRMKKNNHENTIEDQIFHTIEECIEFQKEFLKDKYGTVNWEKFDMENLDILFAWCAIQHILKQNAGVDKFAVGNCLSKFIKRGWLNF